MSLIEVRFAIGGGSDLLANKDSGASLPSLAMTTADGSTYSWTIDFLELRNHSTTVTSIYQDQRACEARVIIPDHVCTCLLAGPWHSHGIDELINGQ